MSHKRLKTKYNTEGSNGNTDEYVLYVDHDNSTDYVTFYDQYGDHIITIPDTVSNNILDAICRLYSPFNNKNGELVAGVELMNDEDRKKCQI